MTVDGFAEWRRSSRCADTTCVEVAFIRSSRCNSSTCVEVHVGQGGVAVRNSQQPETVLVFTAAEWVSFVQGVRMGEFDLEKP